MNRSEAEQRAQQLQREHPDRATHRFVARRSAGEDWEVAKVLLPTAVRPTPLTPTIDARPQPSPAEDPRTGHEQRLPGIPGGLG